MKKRLEGLDADDHQNGIDYYLLKHVWTHLMQQQEGKLDPAQEAAKLNKRKREKLELEIKQTEKELIHIDELRSAMVEPVLNAKAKFLGMGSKLATLVPAITSVEEANEVIGRQIREALDEIAYEGLVRSMETTSESRGQRMGRPKQDAE